MAKITYPNKVTGDTDPTKGKFSASDANQIKSSVNNLYDQTGFAESVVLRNQDYLPIYDESGQLLEYKSTLPVGKLLEKADILDITFDQYPIGAIPNGTAFKDMNGIVFTLQGSGASIVRLSNGRKALRLTGSQRLISTNTAYWKQCSDGTKPFTIVFAGVIGNSANPNTTYGICGNNGYTNGYTGFAIGYADSAQNNQIGIYISGTSGNDPLFESREECATPNELTCLFIEYNPEGNADINHGRIYERGQMRNLFSKQSPPHSTNTPSQNFEIGSFGTNAYPFVGDIQSVKIFTGNTSALVRQDLLKQLKITPKTINDRYVEVVKKRSFRRDYQQGGVCWKNPVTGISVFIAAYSQNHFGDPPAGIYMRRSFNDFQSYFEEKIIFTFADNSNSYYVPSGGYTASGRLCLAMTRQNGTGNDEIVYSYSDDDGATWTSPIVIVGGTNTYPNQLTIDQMTIADDGTLIIPWYGQKTTGNNPDAYIVSCLRSTDGGLTFTVGGTIISGTSTGWENELSIIALSSSKLLAHVRREQSPGFSQYISNNNGASWALQGTTSFGDTWTLKGPPVLRKCLVDGVPVIVAYHYNRDKKQLYSIYAKESEIISSGVSAWTNKTLYPIDAQPEKEDATVPGGYPTVYHFFNDLRAYIVIYSELKNNPLYDSVQAELHISDAHKTKVKQELSIV